MTALRIHAFETGRLIGNETFLRGAGWSSLLRSRRDYEFPAYCFVVEHSAGLIAIDTGMTNRARSPRPRIQRRFVPNPMPAQEIGPAMKASGLDPADVRLVILTHLDWDHAGGLAHFPRAEVLLHRPEHDFATTAPGRWRYEPDLWPAAFAPTLYDLDPEPCGPFPASRAVTDDGAVTIVPLPGHSIGQVGVVVRDGGEQLLFVADHVLRRDWFLEDWEAGRLVGLGHFHRAHARETSRRVHDFIAETPSVLLPSHDDTVPRRLAAAHRILGDAPKPPRHRPGLTVR